MDVPLSLPRACPGHAITCHLCGLGCAILGGGIPHSHARANTSPCHLPGQDLLSPRSQGHPTACHLGGPGRSTLDGRVPPGSAPHLSPRRPGHPPPLTATDGAGSPRGPSTPQPRRPSPPRASPAPVTLLPAPSPRGGPHRGRPPPPRGARSGRCRGPVPPAAPRSREGKREAKWRRGLRPEERERERGVPAAGPGRGLARRLPRRRRPRCGALGPGAPRAAKRRRPRLWGRRTGLPGAPPPALRCRSPARPSAAAAAAAAHARFPARPGPPRSRRQHRAQRRAALAWLRRRGPAAGREGGGAAPARRDRAAPPGRARRPPRRAPGRSRAGASRVPSGRGRTLRAASYRARWAAGCPRRDGDGAREAEAVPPLGAGGRHDGTAARPGCTRRGGGRGRSESCGWCGQKAGMGR